MCEFAKRKQKKIGNIHRQVIFNSTKSIWNRGGKIFWSEKPRGQGILDCFAKICGIKRLYSVLSVFTESSGKVYFGVEEFGEKFGNMI